METCRLEYHLKELDYIMSMHALTIAQVEGMKAENKIREIAGEALAYNEKDFEEVAINNGMTHNASVERQLKH